MGIIRRILFLFISLTLLPFLTGVTNQGYVQDATEWFCEETGFMVRGEFLNYYRSTDNELELFGYPITGEMTDTMGHRFQYFQKARFDYDENTGQVKSATLGSYLYTAGEYEVAKITGDNSLCHIFPNGYKVCYAFLQFYESKNGAEYLGLPISNTEINAGGFFTQYFENGVLEWHPDLGTGRRVQVADLGRLYYDRYIGDIRNSIPPGSNIPSSVQLIPQVDVFTSKAIVSANSTEQIYVIVKDQYQRALPNAKVSIVITLPDGTENIFRSANTNADGISTLDILIGDFEPRDVVHIEARVTFNSEAIATTANTWFRVWW